MALTITNIWFVEFVIICIYFINVIHGNEPNANANTNNNQFLADDNGLSLSNITMNITMNLPNNDHILAMENDNDDTKAIQQRWYIGVITVICVIIIIFIIVGFLIIHQTNLCKDDVVSFSYSTHRKSNKVSDTENLNQIDTDSPQIKVIQLNDDKPIKPKPIRVMSTSSRHGSSMSM